MSDMLFSKGLIPVMERVAAFTDYRHKVIANNIANESTPFYKAMDAPVEDFQAAMRSSMNERDKRDVKVFEMQERKGVQLTQKGRLDITPSEIRSGAFLNHFENTVNIEDEMRKMAENAMMHNASLSLLRHQFDMLQSAIRGQI